MLYEVITYEPLSVFAELIKKSLLTARLKGYRKAQTMVEIGSSDTQILYEKLGFEVIDEKRSELYSDQFGRAGIKRLQIRITSYNVCYTKLLRRTGNGVDRSESGCGEPLLPRVCGRSVLGHGPV